MFTTNQAQPEPKRAAALSANSFLNSSKEPHCSLIFSTTVPFSSEFGESNSQNNEWFKCPPPLLRTAVWMLAGTLSKLATISSIDLDSKSVPSTAAFNFVTYVL